MKKKSWRKQLRQVNKELIEKYNSIDNNTIILTDSDFIDYENDSKLSMDGYDKLKEKIKHINIKEQAVIIIPQKHKNGFLHNMKDYVSKEIMLLSKEMKRLKMTSLSSLLFGSVVFGAANILDQRRIFYEIAIIIFWVFVWGAAEKFFFELPTLRHSKYKLLSLVNSEIKIDTK
jgi:hypothetical protein